MSKRISIPASSLLLSLLLAACASTGDLAPQGKLLNAENLESQRAIQGVARKADWPAADWWRRLGDPQLDALIDETLQGSPDLAIAEARVRSAEAQTLGADAARDARVDLQASIQGARIPETVLPAPIGGHYASPKIIGLKGSYHFDLWGGDRAAWESALGRQRAAEVDVQAARLTLAVNVAETYAALGEAFANLDIAQQERERSRRVRDLTKQLADAGIASISQYKQADAVAASAEQKLAQAAHAVDAERSALAVLLGKGPDRGLDIARPRPLDGGALALPVNLEANLLGRRPDVVAARWRVEASARDIDVAKAAFYPNINLSATVGTAAMHAADLFTGASRLALFAPAVSLPLFDGGRLRAGLAGRDAEYDLAVAQYNKTLVTAVNQVALEVQSLQSLDAQLAAQKQAVDAAREAWDFAMQRYRRGIGSYVEALSAQQTVLVSEQTFNALQAQKVAASVRLVQALGGGYEDKTAAETSTPTHTKTAQTQMRGDSAQAPTEQVHP